MNKDHLLSNYDYELPQELIAQHPAESRDASRLLVYHRHSGTIEHRRFFNFTDYVYSSDLMVFNNTKVFNARLFGERCDTGGRIEMLLLKQAGNEWEVLLKPAKRVVPGQHYSFGGDKITADVISVLGEGIFTVRLQYSGDLFTILDTIGEVPLPPYIKRDDQYDENAHLDKNRYQTIYASNTGAAAAPTAGLHFSEKIFAAIESKGVTKKFVTLHVGLGTFQPLRNEIVPENSLHAEYVNIPPETALEINANLGRKKNIIVVGTTTTRAIESAAHKDGTVLPLSKWTDLFIYPPYEFKVVRNLLTNFHLPKTSLMMMVSALIGREELLRIYREAVREKYRFYSYGDAMLILDN